MHEAEKLQIGGRACRGDHPCIGGGLWEYGKGTDAALFSNSWAQTPDEVVQLGTQLSGMMLLEQLALLEREGQLP
ncbi:hypothetical protein B1748_20100 [Paenibacillus sp. MY03]|uniref:hypothetical protein n=1 Tax=Paenibacillus sp. MY03 TaxID=302980 RepID=UPI000B3C3D2D|nr:hypothetical protein [Paenibacillus sp. MY03]OUS74883.1 hypothetical protein B1748_20100 [Paenibacillus sp. MY03]